MNSLDSLDLLLDDHCSEDVTLAALAELTQAISTLKTIRGMATDALVTNSALGYRVRGLLLLNGGDYEH